MDRVTARRFLVVCCFASLEVVSILATRGYEACTVCSKQSEMTVACERTQEGDVRVPGVCMPKSLVTTNPECPAGANAGVTTLGGKSFEQVFNKNTDAVNFVCRKICDGRGTYDTGQCSGPHACNVLTCEMARASSETAGVTEVRSCPVAITEEELASFTEQNVFEAIDLKRSLSCEPCTQCGRSDSTRALYESLGGENYGMGCARECTTQLCTAPNVYDFTQQQCVECAQLRDTRLCPTSDQQRFKLRGGRITGLIPKVFFPNCIGKSATPDGSTPSYGTCEECSTQAACSPRQYESQCGVCSECSTSRAADVDSRATEYLDFEGNRKTLPCQITSCRNPGKTGLSSDGRLCVSHCSQKLCAENEELQACTLPHDARCAKMHDTTLWPATRIVGMIPHSANLLETGDVVAGERFASFENALVDLIGRTDDDRFQCVFNAAVITDSVHEPGGISSLFAPHTQSDALAERGTRHCRINDRTQDTVIPLMPLQNVVTRTSDTFSFPRRVLVNTPARACAYSYTGSSFVSDVPSFTRLSPTPDTIAEPGEMFLALNMNNTKSASVAVFVPDDIVAMHSIARFQISAAMRSTETQTSSMFQVEMNGKNSETLQNDNTQSLRDVQDCNCAPVAALETPDDSTAPSEPTPILRRRNLLSRTQSCTCDKLTVTDFTYPAWELQDGVDKKFTVEHLADSFTWNGFNQKYDFFYGGSYGAHDRDELMRTFLELSGGSLNTRFRPFRTTFFYTNVGRAFIFTPKLWLQYGTDSHAKLQYNFFLTQTSIRIAFEKVKPISSTTSNLLRRYGSQNRLYYIADDKMLFYLAHIYGRIDNIEFAQKNEIWSNDWNSHGFLTLPLMGMIGRRSNPSSCALVTWTQHDVICVKDAGYSEQYLEFDPVATTDMILYSGAIVDAYKIICVLDMHLNGTTQFWVARRTSLTKVIQWGRVQTKPWVQRTMTAKNYCEIQTPKPSECIPDCVQSSNDTEFHVLQNQYPDLKKQIVSATAGEDADMYVLEISDSKLYLTYHVNLSTSGFESNPVRSSSLPIQITNQNSINLQLCKIAPSEKTVVVICMLPHYNTETLINELNIVQLEQNNLKFITSTSISVVTNKIQSMLSTLWITPDINLIIGWNGQIFKTICKETTCVIQKSDDFKIVQNKHFAQMKTFPHNEDFMNGSALATFAIYSKKTQVLIKSDTCPLGFTQLQEPSTVSESCSVVKKKSLYSCASLCNDKVLCQSFVWTQITNSNGLCKLSPNKEIKFETRKNTIACSKAKTSFYLQDGTEVSHGHTLRFEAITKFIEIDRTTTQFAIGYAVIAQNQDNEFADIIEMPTYQHPALSEPQIMWPANYNTKVITSTLDWSARIQSLISKFYPYESFNPCVVYDGTAPIIAPVYIEHEIHNETKMLQNSVTITCAKFKWTEMIFDLPCPSQLVFGDKTLPCNSNSDSIVLIFNGLNQFYWSRLSPKPQRHWNTTHFLTSSIVLRGLATLKQFSELSSVSELTLHHDRRTPEILLLQNEWKRYIFTSNTVEVGEQLRFDIKTESLLNSNTEIMIDDIRLLPIYNLRPTGFTDGVGMFSVFKTSDYSTQFDNNGFMYVTGAIFFHDTDHEQNLCVFDMFVSFHDPVLIFSQSPTLKTELKAPAISQLGCRVSTEKRHCSFWIPTSAPLGNDSMIVILPSNESQSISQCATAVSDVHVITPPATAVRACVETNHFMSRISGACEPCALPAEQEYPCSPGTRIQGCERLYYDRPTCVPCDGSEAGDVNASRATFTRGCETECSAGFHKNERGRCVSCDTDLACAPGKYQVPCSEDRNTYCAQCASSAEYHELGPFAEQVEYVADPPSTLRTTCLPVLEGTKFNRRCIDRRTWSFMDSVPVINLHANDADKWTKQDSSTDDRTLNLTGITADLDGCVQICQKNTACVLLRHLEVSSDVSSIKSCLLIFDTLPLSASGGLACDDPGVVMSAQYTNLAYAEHDADKDGPNVVNDCSVMPRTYLSCENVHGNCAGFKEDLFSCASTCAPGYFRSAPRTCSACRSAQAALEVLDAGESFVRFTPCTAVSDVTAEVCPPVANGQLVANGPSPAPATSGPITTADTVSCPVVCDPGYYPADETSVVNITNPSLAESPSEPLVYESTLTVNTTLHTQTCQQCAHQPAIQALFDSGAASYDPTPANPCNFECIHPYIAIGGTCLDCSLCADGEYARSDDSCNCHACDPDLLQEHYAWASAGALDDPASCAVQCGPGYYDKHALGVCAPWSESPLSPDECKAEHWFRDASPFHDYACLPCKKCTGQRTVTPCTATSDAECEPCGVPPIGGFFAGDNCSPACRSGHELSPALDDDPAACVPCPPCSVGSFLQANTIDCTCTPCQDKPPDSEWVSSSVKTGTQACAWVCRPGFAPDGNGDCKALEDPDARIANMASARLTRTVRCEPGYTLNEDYECEPCQVKTPPENLKSSVWNWNTLGSPCSWTCSDGLFRHANPSLPDYIACVTEEQLVNDALVSADEVSRTSLAHVIMPTIWINAFAIFFLIMLT